MPAYPPEGHMFRSAAYVAMQEQKVKLSEAEADLAAAQGRAAAVAADLAALEQVEAERILSVKQKELRSRVAAARLRVSSIAKAARDLEAAMPAVHNAWSALWSEIGAFNALLPAGLVLDDLAIRHVQDLVGDEFLRGALDNLPLLPGAPLGRKSLPQPLTETIEAVGRQAVETLSAALGLPGKAAQP
jgi:hypothetical protein